MRAQEPMGMKWTEVRLDLRMLRLPARRTKGKEPKAITLDGDLLKLIQQQRKLHNDKFPSCEYVFPDNQGQKITYDRAIDQFQAACKRAGIAEGFTTWDGQLRKPGFHDLRRTFAREADRCRVPHDEIMAIAGWKTHAMLLRYLGCPEDHMRSAFSAMDAGYGKVRQQAVAD
jgi:integrase